MDQATQQNAALVEQMAAAAGSLKSQAGDLVQTVAVFRLEAVQGQALAMLRAPAGPGNPRLPLRAEQRRAITAPATRPVPAGAPALAPARVALAKAPAAKPAAPMAARKQPKSLPQPTLMAKASPAAADDDWETF